MLLFTLMGEARRQREVRHDQSRTNSNKHSQAGSTHSLLDQSPSTEWVTSHAQSPRQTRLRINGRERNGARISDALETGLFSFHSS